MDPYAFKKFSSAEREKIQDIVSAQGHEGILLCPEWLEKRNILLGFESRKIRGTLQICPVINKLDPHKPAFVVADKKAAFIRTIIPNACMDPQYLSPERITIHAGEYPLGASSKQRVRIDPRSDDMGYSKRAIEVIKAWQSSAVEYLASNPHLHDLVSPTSGKSASADEIRSILRNKSDTSFRPIIDDTGCEEGEVGVFYAHNRIFKARGQKKGDPTAVNGPDPSTKTVMEHKDFAVPEVREAFERVLEDSSFSLKLKPITVVMPNGTTVSYGDRIHTGAIGSIRVSFGPLHVRNDGGKTQTTFTHYCDQIKLYSNGPDPEPSVGTNFMTLFDKTPGPDAATPIKAVASKNMSTSSVAAETLSADLVVTSLDSGDETVTEDVEDVNELGGMETPRPARKQLPGAASDDASDTKRKRMNKLAKKVKRVKKSAG